MALGQGFGFDRRLIEGDHLAIAQHHLTSP